MKFKLIEDVDKQQKRKDKYIYTGSCYTLDGKYICDIKEPITTMAVSREKAISNICFKIKKRLEKSKNIVNGYTAPKVHIDKENVKLVSSDIPLTYTDKRFNINYNDNSDYNIPDESYIELDD